ncbi:MAG: site-specific integrase [Candidatus Aenigmarchaeota archaeon]|nr:site-specific integrase [Candidatus Aenigmarchaeota archaeon]
MLELLKFNSVQRMLGDLKLLTRSKNTEKTYLKGLKEFVRSFKIDNLDAFVQQLKSGEKNPNEVYKEFVISLANKELAPKTVGAWSSSLKKFFLANGIELKQEPSIKIYNIHEDLLPSKQDLRKVFLVSDLRTRVIISLLASSGLRVDELRNLKLGDLDLNSTPPIIRVKGISAKERKSRITFISQEAREILSLYLEKRGELNPESYVITSRKNEQMSYQTLQWILNKAFRLVSKKEGKRFKLHAHSLRKWFKTQLIAAGVPGPIVDRLAGHARYLAREYELYSEEQLKEWYLKGMKSLEIMS